jgi:hypothetical protein
MGWPALLEFGWEKLRQGTKLATGLNLLTEKLLHNGEVDQDLEGVFC